MPFIRIQLLEGRSSEQKEIAAKKITNVVSEELNSPKENIKVIFEDIKKTDYFPAGEKIK